MLNKGRVGDFTLLIIYKCIYKSTILMILYYFSGSCTYILHISNLVDLIYKLWYSLLWGWMLTCFTRFRTCSYSAIHSQSIHSFSWQYFVEMAWVSQYRPGHTLEIRFLNPQPLLGWDENVWLDNYVTTLLQFKSLGAAQRDAIMKAVNNDAQKILADPSGLSESKQAKLRDALQKCNDQYNKLNKKLREKVCRTKT